MQNVVVHAVRPHIKLRIVWYIFLLWTELDQVVERPAVWRSFDWRQMRFGQQLYIVERTNAQIQIVGVRLDPVVVELAQQSNSLAFLQIEITAHLRLKVEQNSRPRVRRVLFDFHVAVQL